MLRISIEQAEDIKMKYASAKASLSSTKLDFDVPSHNSDSDIQKISENELLVELIEPASSIAPGQFGVLFSGTKVIGGGRISSKLMESAS